MLVVAGLFSALTAERSADTELPAPTGALAVSRAIYDWRDQTHEVLAWVWYPVAPDPSAPAEDYMPPPMLALYGPPGPPIRWVTRDLARVHPHSVTGGRLPPGAAYPVVLLRSGGTAPVVTYTTLAEDLASHGYVVLGIDVPTLTSRVVFPDGRVIRRTGANDLERYADDDRVRAATRLLGIRSRPSSVLRFAAPTTSSSATTAPC